MMSAVWKSILALYNLLLIAISVGVVAVAMGRLEPIQWINMGLSSAQNRWVMAGTGVVLALLGLYLLIRLFHQEKVLDVVIQESEAGRAIITIPAIKSIIMKSVKPIEGIREIRPEVVNGINGVIVDLTLLVNPDYKVPDMTGLVQETVRSQLEEVGGVKVSEVRIRVDDFVTKVPAR